MDYPRAMNTTKRFIYGILSSALLAVGLVRAADLFDPMNLSLSESPSSLASSAPNTISQTHAPLLTSSAPNTVSQTHAPTLDS